jgi:hypothetical protein
MNALSAETSPPASQPTTTRDGIALAMLIAGLGVVMVLGHLPGGETTGRVFARLGVAAMAGCTILAVAIHVAAAISPRATARLLGSRAGAFWVPQSIALFTAAAFIHPPATDPAALAGFAVLAASIFVAPARDRGTIVSRWWVGLTSALMLGSAVAMHLAAR